MGFAFTAGPMAVVLWLAGDDYFDSVLSTNGSHIAGKGSHRWYILIN
jgi:hypothetical protein